MSREQIVRAIAEACGLEYDGLILRDGGDMCYVLDEIGYLQRLWRDKLPGRKWCRMLLEDGPLCWISQDENGRGTVTVPDTGSWLDDILALTLAALKAKGNT